jgi:hypothetical protein
MTTRTKPPFRAAVPLPGAELSLNFQMVAPWTTEDRLRHIEAMGQRITAYVRFMCQVGNWVGTSDETKDHAVKAFYERLAVMERQLGRIQEELRLS